MKTKYLFIIALTALFAACTDLKEELRDQITAEEFAQLQDVESLLLTAYRQMRLPYQDQSRFWAAQEHTGDGALGPTRGPDWDDNGVWRVLHNHQWNEDHSFLGNTFDELLGIVYTTTDLLQFEPTPQQEAEARFIRAYVVFSIVDGWNQVPIRDAGENLLLPPRVMVGDTAVQYVIDECKAILNDLPDGPANVANKDAARALLMKAYINKGTMSDRSNPTYPVEDMNEVLKYAEEIKMSGRSYTLSDDYFDNFAPNNDQISTENIWTAENEGGVTSGNVRSRWFCTLHYNQNPSGWNGFTTLGDLYDSFEDSDTRRGGERDGMTDRGGIRTGLLLGQQFNELGEELDDRKGNKLAFTKEVALIESGDNLEVTGIRVIKYPIDYDNGDNADNDYVYLRYADVLLMEAEAHLRKGDAGTALGIVNQIRTKRGASELGSLDEAALLAERGRELYWEGWRRNDMIRFGVFLDAWDGKPASGKERLLFPIPANALAVNPNLKQNCGYGSAPACD